jgi:hypothetical protein
VIKGGRGIGSSKKNYQQEINVLNPPLFPPLIGSNLLPWQKFAIKGGRAPNNLTAFHQASSPFDCLVCIGIQKSNIKGGQGD